MNCLNYLKEHQDIPYKIFKNALENNKLFHCYLLVGEIGTPLLEIATYLAASIIDNNSSPFVEEDSNIYKRIQNGSYNDFKLLDAAKGSVKIDEIRSLEDQFSRTATEINGKKVYIINLIENLNIDSVNALLKFLEEPQENTYAFLLTNNEFKLLPTIRSRAQTVHFSLIDRATIINEAIELGCDEGDAQILSYFYNDAELVTDIAKEKTFIALIGSVIDTLQYVKNYHRLMENVLNDLVKKVKDKNSARQLFDILIVFFKEALKYKINSKTYLEKYDTILLELSKKDNLEDSILVLMNSRNEVNYNMNTNLLIVHTMQKIFG